MADCEDPSTTDAVRWLTDFTDLTLDFDTRIDALNDLRVPTTALLVFIAALDDDMRHLALRVCMDGDVLRRWALAGNAADRYDVASNYWSQPEILAILAGDLEPGVRAAAARNAAISIDALAWLLTDPDPEVRQALATSEAMATPWPEVFEDRPGSDDTLDLLYELVEGAIELECMEQLRQEEIEARSKELAAFHADEGCLDTAESEAPEHEHPTQDAALSGPSLWEALEVLRSGLGATELNEAEREDFQHFQWLIANEPPPEL